MSPDDRFAQAKTLLTDLVDTWVQPEADRLDGTLTADRLTAAVERLTGSQWGYLATITGLDITPGTGDLEVLYHFCSADAVLTLRISLSRAAPVVPSICAIIPFASPFERETGEMFGIVFTGTPDTSRLFLPDDWEEGVYPLRKDVVLKEKHDEHEPSK